MLQLAVLHHAEQLGIKIKIHSPIKQIDRDAYKAWEIHLKSLDEKPGFELGDAETSNEIVDTESPEMPAGMTEQIYQAVKDKAIAAKDARHTEIAKSLNEEGYNGKERQGTRYVTQRMDSEKITKLKNGNRREFLDQEIPAPEEPENNLEQENRLEQDRGFFSKVFDRVRNGSDDSTTNPEQVDRLEKVKGFVSKIFDGARNLRAAPVEEPQDISYNLAENHDTPEDEQNSARPVPLMLIPEQRVDDTDPLTGTTIEATEQARTTKEAFTNGAKGNGAIPSAPDPTQNIFSDKFDPDALPEDDDDSEATLERLTAAVRKRTERPDGGTSPS